MNGFYVCMAIVSVGLIYVAIRYPDNEGVREFEGQLIGPRLRRKFSGQDNEGDRDASS